MLNVMSLKRSTLKMLMLFGSLYHVVLAMDVSSQDTEQKKSISTLIASGRYDLLEDFLIVIREHQPSQIESAHDQVVQCVLKIFHACTSDIIEPYFNNIPEGTFKLAMRFVYAIKTMKNLDDYDCAQLLCPNRVESRLHLITGTSATKGYVVPVWHMDLSNHPLCTEELTPAILCLLPQIIRRIYPGNAFTFNPPLKSIDLSKNELDIDSLRYLLPNDIEFKEETATSKNNAWGLGPVSLIDDQNDRRWLQKVVQNGLKNDKNS